MERLEGLLRASEQNAIPMRETARHLFQVQAMLAEIDVTKAQLKRVESKISWLSPDEEKMRACNALKTRLERLINEFEEYCATARAQAP